MSSNPTSLLKSHKLRVTDCRLATIEEFLEKQVALSHGDLEESLGQKFDRVTIYRTLKTFQEKDVVHMVLDDKGVTKYALCNHDHGAEKHSHEHVHFKCTKCQETVCIESAKLPNITLPEGFVKKEMSLLVQGTCDKCA
ncbi:transcriptional repressor [Algoriphagus sediminis]|uniref:Transcriptional repressor n=1 Tax=Algoriphagus sediminis TaxID=3057113 RepID=A0ABT7YBB3_9BACT|nr:transcriptional repressor [Algoriphagus sediminis]MDN3203806.1 transcriptional repressor [Algoriphagus sediminis]